MLNFIQHNRICAILLNCLLQNAQDLGNAPTKYLQYFLSTTQLFYAKARFKLLIPASMEIFYFQSFFAVSACGQGAQHLPNIEYAALLVATYPRPCKIMEDRGAVCVESGEIGVKEEGHFSVCWQHRNTRCILINYFGHPLKLYNRFHQDWDQDRTRARTWYRLFCASNLLSVFTKTLAGHLKHTST